LLVSEATRKGLKLYNFLKKKRMNFNKNNSFYLRSFGFSHVSLPFSIRFAKATKANKKGINFCLTRLTSSIPKAIDEGKGSSSFLEKSIPNNFKNSLDLSIQIKKEEYILETFKRSNQDTCLTHKPAVSEGTWVQSGDFLTDCASSVGGELSLGQNLLIAYMPWEGYNFEDAILISERLVIDDLYTSVHIERYELETQKTKLGSEEITRNIPDASEQDLSNLDSYGIVKIGSWVEEGDILVGKITPINKKKISPYQKLLYTILEKQVRPIKDSSLRAPKGIKAKVIDIKYFLKASSKQTSNSQQQLNKTVNSLKTTVKNLQTKHTSSRLKFENQDIKSSSLSLFIKRKNVNNMLLNVKNTKNIFSKFNLVPFTKKTKYVSKFAIKNLKKNFFSKLNSSFSKIKQNSFQLYFQYLRFILLTQIMNKRKMETKTNKIKPTLVNKKNQNLIKFSSKIQSNFCLTQLQRSSKSSFSGFSNNSSASFSPASAVSAASPFYSFGSFGSFVQTKKGKRFISHEKNTLNLKFRVKKPFNEQTKSISKQKKDLFINKIETVHIYLAEKRKIQVGDKMAGRHGNKGIVSQILPIQDMPYLPDGTPIDMVLNPLGVPSRMNVGQIYECLLGLAGKLLGENYKINSFDEIYGPEASRSFVFNKLYEARSKTGFKWLFDPNSPGKIQLFDGRNGLFFDQKVTVGQAYILRLVHMVDDKIHCLTPDHDVLTNEGWLPINEINLNHKIATLTNKNGQLVYQNPNEIFLYNNYKGFLYVLKNKNINLAVTLNHRMYVTKPENNSNSFNNYQLIEAKNIIGKNYQYLKNAIWLKDDYQFVLPSFNFSSTFISEKKVDMNAWLVFFGIWITKTNTQANSNINVNVNVNKKVSELPFNQLSMKSIRNDTKDSVEISLNSDFCSTVAKNSNFVHNNRNSLSSKTVQTNTSLSTIQVSHLNTRVFYALKNSLIKLNYNYEIIENKLIINNKQLKLYLNSLNISTKNSLPLWVWELSQKQAQLLLNSMCLDNENFINNSLNYFTNNVQLADDIMRLALHAGWSANKTIHFKKETKIGTSFTLNDLWSINILKETNTLFNNNNLQNSQEEVIQYEGPVYCLSVPNQIFYVRKNGIPVWTGNSRSTGPYSLVTQQPLRGRSKQGGQRLGEMEVWALEGYGAAFTLLEMLTIKSDDMTGRMTLWSNLILNKDISIGTPESFKVLVCELQALCLDIGLFRNINSTNVNANYSNTNLREINNLINLP
jgi:hypothetical protein